MHAGEKRAHLWKNSRRLHQGLRDLGFALGTETAQSAIIAIILLDQETTVRLWQALLELGLYVNMARPPATPRTEEPTSEIQSLMRISYAVFCLKKLMIYNNLLQ